MFRFLLACLFYTTVARWGYNEVALMFPSAVPYMNDALAKIQIPTHNTWSRATMHDYIDMLGDKLSQAEDAIDDIETYVNDHTNSPDDTIG